MKNQHTPGPWNPCAGKIIASNAIAVCSMPNRDSANTNLIASAPDLLSALEWAVSQIEDDLCPDHQAALAGCRAALAKAKGEA